MNSMPLFPPSDLPLPDHLITRPALCESVKDFKHVLRQLDVVLIERDEISCHLLLRRNKKDLWYYGRLAVWLDGNWSCLHRENCCDDPIPPGQLHEAYTASRAGFRFYHLETRTTRDLVIHV